MSIQDEIDVIDFYRPIGNGHSIYLSGILASAEMIQELEDELLAKFSSYGLIYNIHIIDALHNQPIKCNYEKNNVIKDVNVQAEDQSFSSKEKISDKRSQYYAFVGFYSIKAASKALLELSGKITLFGKPIKLKLSRTNNTFRKTLYVTDCYKLANHYLNFNGWCVEIIEHSVSREASSRMLHSKCRVKLHIKYQVEELIAIGSAALQRQYDQTDVNLGILYCSARKLSYRLATEDAFSKVVLAVLPNGKVYADVLEPVLNNNLNFLRVNELGEQPLSDSDEGDTLDQQNQYILAALAMNDCDSFM